MDEHTEREAAGTDASDEPGGAGPGPGRRWPLGMAATVGLLVVVAFGAGIVGWALGRDRPERFDEADAGFLADMAVHHNSAVAMGFDYLGRGADPTVAHYAREIIQNQSGEMTAMSILLSEAGDPPIARDEIAMEWMGHPVAAAEMPGMPSVADTRALQAASGAAADEAFTRLMITHHEAGVMMAREAARRGRHPVVVRLARTMARVQRYEIAEMNRRRVQLGFSPITTDFHMDHTDAGHAAHSG